jgi:cytochrome P450 family 9
VLIIEWKDFYTRYTNDVIATAAFGISVDSLKQPTNEFYMMGQDLTNMGGYRVIKWTVYMAVPKLMQVSMFSLFAPVKT